MSEDKEILSPEERALISDNSSKATKAKRIVWIAWWGGTALVVASWFNIVSNTVGWIGFSLALASTFISVIVSKYWKFPKQ